MKQYRLIKSEPYKYSWDDFFRDGETMWDGVRSYEARNNLAKMKKGDLCFWYHSNEGKEIVGVAKVSKEAYPDPTAAGEKGDRVAVELQPEEKLKQPVTLEMIKSDKKLASISLLRQSRLSVAPITKEEFEYIIKVSHNK